MTAQPIRQGDVFLLPVADLPESAAIPAERGNLIMARGEVTGHAHFVPGAHATLLHPVDAMRRIAEEFGVTDPRGVIAALRVDQATTLFHGTPTSDPAGPVDYDHTALPLEVGNYLVIQPREYTGEDDFRVVAD